jgi:hypothetical protein
MKHRETTLSAHRSAAIRSVVFYPSELSFYDRQTGLFFSGDFLLPGRLLIANKSADLASAKRAAQFVEN